MSWRAQVITLYPEMFPGPLAHSLAGRGLAEGRWRLETIALRDFGIGRHARVDDTPAGGGPGMVLRADVLAAAIDAARAAAPGLPLIAPTPRGPKLTQARVRALSEGPGVALLCGRFEGFDERIFAGRGVEPLSVADIVLSGGEPAAMLILDACVRLLPGVMGAASSGTEESFEGSGLLEYPHYTRPAVWEGHGIPEVLTSGDHGKIEAWRQRQRLEDTRRWRPDLLDGQASPSRDTNPPHERGHRAGEPARARSEES
ncbi:MAG: tRNA (guanosine(37)-N1)-methyltransferase TrmD [Sphingomonadaceae bacterium]